MDTRLVILDGLADTRAARRLSRVWFEAGLVNRVDVAGQAGWIEVAEGDDGEAAVDRAVHVAARVGVLVEASGDDAAAGAVDAAARMMAGRYRRALLIGTAAVAWLVGLHVGQRAWVAPGSAAWWLGCAAQVLLVGLMLFVPGRALWRNAVWATVHARASPDVLTVVLALSLAMPPAAAMGVSLLGAALPAGLVAFAQRPTFVYAGAVVWLALLQRWLYWRAASMLGQRGHLVLRRFGVWVAIWLGAMLLLVLTAGISAACAFGLLLPPLASHGGIGRRSPGAIAALPVLGFTGLFLVAMLSSLGGAAFESARLEIALGFQLIMAGAYAINWRSMGERSVAAS